MSIAITGATGKWRFNTVTREDLAKGISSVLNSTDKSHEHKTYELTAPGSWAFPDLASALSDLAGKTVVHREDPQIQDWIYGYLAKMNTSSISADLETLIGGPASSLKESILSLISPK
ncbi:hypothetical protein [Paenibacillus macerans]|uniref:hypothetical protein n=1 Tax=Paenibacillus macerans TaxID=44252 RepID=UPI003D31B855